MNWMRTAIHILQKEAIAVLNRRNEEKEAEAEEGTDLVASVIFFFFSVVYSDHTPDISQETRDSNIGKIKP